MAEKKRFYWIKLKENFFDLETIDFLKAQKNGCEYIVLYQQLCLLTANKNGRLAAHLGEMLIPYDINKIARDTKFDVDTVIVAMELFRKIGLLYEEADGILRIPYVEEIVGSETPAAQRKRKSRANKSLEAAEGVTMSQNRLGQCHTEKENREKILDKRDLDNRALEEEEEEEPSAEAETFGNSGEQNSYEKIEPFRYDNVFLSDAQVESLLKIMDIKVFDSYVDKITNYPNVKNHYETIKKWHTEDSKVTK